MGNVFKTGLLLAVLTCLVVLIGQALGASRGMIMAFGLALVMNFVSYWFSDKMVLAMYRAQPVDEAQAPQLHGLVRNLTTRAGIPDAEGVHHPQRDPQCLRHRAQSGACGDRGDGRHPADPRSRPSWKACSPTSWRT